MDPNDDEREDSPDEGEHPTAVAEDTQAAEDARTEAQNKARQATLEAEEQRERMLHADYTRKRQTEVAEHRRAMQEIEEKQRILDAHIARAGEDIKVMGLVRNNRAAREQFLEILAPIVGDLPDPADSRVATLEERMNRYEEQKREDNAEGVFKAIGAVANALVASDGLTPEEMKALGTRAFREGEISLDMRPEEAAKKLRRFVRDETHERSRARAQGAVVDQIEEGSRASVSPKPGANAPAPKEPDVLKMSRDQYSDHVKRKLGYAV